MTRADRESATELVATAPHDLTRSWTTGWRASTPEIFKQGISADPASSLRRAHSRTSFLQRLFSSRCVSLRRVLTAPSGRRPASDQEPIGPRRLRPRSLVPFGSPSAGQQHRFLTTRKAQDPRIICSSRSRKERDRPFTPTKSERYRIHIVPSATPTEGFPRGCTISRPVACARRRQSRRRLFAYSTSSRFSAHRPTQLKQFRPRIHRTLSPGLLVASSTTVPG